MKIININVFAFCIIFTVLTLNGCNSTTQNNSSVEYKVDESDFIQGNELIENIEPSALTSDEIAGLILMREEEKLARDVYQTLYKTWNIKIFNNIAESEQTHTDAIKTLLDRYKIDDPVTDNQIGIFSSNEIDNLYKSLTAKGKTSLIDALKVGATIEDLDIKDLNNLTANTDNEDIISTYNNLNKGSRNHLRAFMKQIQANNGSYTPQFISQSEFDNIITTAQERGRVR